MYEPTWYERIKTEFSAVHFVIVGLVLAAGILYIFSPNLISLISPPSDITYKITPVKSEVYRPDGFFYTISIQNNGVFSKNILVESYPQDSGMVSKQIHVGAKESKEETLHFNVNTLGNQSFFTTISWVGPLFIDRIKIGQEDSSFIVLGVDYSIDSVKSILNIATRDKFNFRITNIGNVVADRLDVRVISKGVLSLASQETKTISDLSPGQSELVDFSFSVPASAEEGQIKIIIGLDTSFGNYKESFERELQISLQTSPQTLDLENAKYSLQLVAGVIIAFSAIGAFSRRNR